MYEEFNLKYQPIVFFKYWYEKCSNFNIINVVKSVAFVP